MDKNKKQENSVVTRPPVVVIMGHIDHGKSTLLDFIRKTNVAETEAGNITQHISAYEVKHKDEHGKDRTITFLDTPGHEAFSQMRERSAKVADIAILVVSAAEGVKPQTIEAWKTIVSSNTPAIVAINKIDKPEANIEKTKAELAENEIYLENYGGKVPFALISAKTGEGIDGLLSLILILAELENFTGNKQSSASGLIIETSLDSKRGIQATLIIKDGTLKKGMVVAAEDAICATRILESFRGEMITSASFSSPIRLVGWDKNPKIGGEFRAFAKKSEAETYVKEWQAKNAKKTKSETETGLEREFIPLVLKADVAGSLEAIEKEIAKIKNEGASFRVIQRGTGPIVERDIKSIGVGENAIVVGFGVKTERNANEMAEQRGIGVASFDIIYKMTEWLTQELEKRRTKVATAETLGKAKILKTFSRTKERQIVGGKVLEGKIAQGGMIKILRRDFEIGQGKIVNLERNKEKTSEVEAGSEFGTMIESKTEIAPGDTIEPWNIVHK